VRTGCHAIADCYMIANVLSLSTQVSGGIFDSATSLPVVNADEPSIHALCYSYIQAHRGLLPTVSEHSRASQPSSSDAHVSGNNEDSHAKKDAREDACVPRQHVCW